MDSEFQKGDAVEIGAGQRQPRYDRLVMRGGRFFLEGKLADGEPFTVQLGPSDASSTPPAR